MRAEGDTSRRNAKWPAVSAITELPVRSDAAQREKKMSNLGDSEKAFGEHGRFSAPE